MLHIHNGEVTAETALRSSIPGEHFAFRDALIAGPVPANAPLSEWRELRSTHLAAHYGVDRAETDRVLLLQDEVVDQCSQHDEVVLWFEHDLFCQTNLLYLLNRLADSNLGKTALSLICIGEFDGIEKFDGLGQLTTDQLESLFPGRQEVTTAQLRLAKKAWAAYGATNPTEMEKLLQTETGALPFLGSAFRSHLARFPSVRNGLGRVEQCGLELIAGGFRDFSVLFPAFGKAEPVYGLGDFQFWLTLRNLADATEPLLTITHAVQVGQELNSEDLRQTHFELTEAGKLVLAGQSDFVSMNGIDLWLGGVHLFGKGHLWRWDDENQRLVFS